MTKRILNLTEPGDLSEISIAPPIYDEPSKEIWEFLYNLQYEEMTVEEKHRFERVHSQKNQNWLAVLNSAMERGIAKIKK